MKVSCRFSGIEFRTEYFNLQTLGEHPLFHLSTDRLLSLYRVWLNQNSEDEKSPKLGETETKLLFTALLNSTNLVQFQVPARPDFVTSTKYLPKLAEFVAFRQTIPNVEVAFPHIAISPETQNCLSVGTWLDRWDDCKKDWMDNYKSAHLNLKLQHMEELLLKLIKSPEGNQARKISRLAQWALIASQAPVGLHSYWTSLFKLSGLELFQAKTVDIEELLGHMEEHLPHGSNFSFETLRHLREIFARNSSGLLFNLGGGAGNTELDVFDFKNNLYKFVEDDLESINRKVAASSAPLKEPVRADYESLVSYLQDKASWLLAANEQVIRNSVEAREKEYNLRAEKDAISDEEAELEAELEEEIIEDTLDVIKKHGG